MVVPRPKEQVCVASRKMCLRLDEDPESVKCGKRPMIAPFVFVFSKNKIALIESGGTYRIASVQTRQRLLIFKAGGIVTRIAVSLYAFRRSKIGQNWLMYLLDLINL